jgi:predicted anti-sigma-YlaC factor YlaD
MDCKTLAERFEALLDGTLSTADTLACSQHLKSCPICCDLMEFVDNSLQTSLGSANLRPPADLVSSVLSKTSGPTCDHVQLVLGDLVDGITSRTDRSLIQRHLAECVTCNELGSIYFELKQDLPLLAELKPDSTLVDDVLAATLPASARIRRWWTATWPQLILRPRFALEAAYIGTLALVLVLLTAGSSLEAMPRKAIAVTQSHPVARLREPVSALESRIMATIEPAWTSTRGKTVANLDRATERSRVLFTKIVDQGGTLLDSFASLLERPDTKRPLGSNESTKETR